MPLDNIRKEIEQKFETDWNLSDADVDYGGVNEVKSSPFVRLHIQPGASINLSVGSGGCVTRTGNVSAIIFIATGKGLGEAWVLADKVKNIFENTRVNGIRLFETSVYDRGTDKGNHIFEATTYYEVEET